jgi:hypothetical protein
MTKSVFSGSPDMDFLLLASTLCLTQIPILRVHLTFAYIIEVVLTCKDLPTGTLRPAAMGRSQKKAPKLKAGVHIEAGTHLYYTYHLTQRN